ncbi:MAG TPA: threonine ammonia-lyase [Gaiellaceae bacterium]|nr:threonine ammonia-lyase [Gaiellaceae bacterium]
MASQTAPTLSDVEAARARIGGVARVTPVGTTENLSKLLGREVQFKAENLQRTGSFKIRGAVNKLSTLSDEERAAGVVAASAGNHGQSVAWAARRAGIRATIFVPQDAPMAKVEAARGYGAACELGGAMFDEALEAALAFSRETGATFVHAFEDEVVIAGQGTIGLELAEQVPEIGTVLIPIGGGGLAAGIAIALRALRPGVRLVGVQAGKSGYTIADGIFVKHPGALTTAILDDLLDEVVDVDDDAIAQAIVLLLERTKLLVEGAGAVGLAALLSGKVPGDGSVCCLLSGGNIDATLLISVMRNGLSLAGRYLVVRSKVPDRPGELLKLLQLVADERVNVVSVGHHREGAGISVGETGVELTLQTRDEEHCEQTLSAMRRGGYPTERLR